jgi:hemoglobin-like flavoprotein
VVDVSDPDVGQRDKLVAALGAVVCSVDELDKVVPLLEQLGRDHRRFAVITEHYTAVGASLLAMLKSSSGLCGPQIWPIPGPRRTGWSPR